MGLRSRAPRGDPRKAILVGITADQLKRGRTKMAAKELPNRRKRNRLRSIFPSVMAPILHWSHLQKSLTFAVKRQCLSERFFGKKTRVLQD